MENYDWKQHYAVPMTQSGQSPLFQQYHLENGTGSGEVISVVIQPGVQAIYNDLSMFFCAAPVTPSEAVIEINYCLEGRYECELNDRYRFYVGRGDLSVGCVGRTESHGGFPTKRFRGLSLFLEIEKIQKTEAWFLQELEIDLDMIRSLAVKKPHYFILHKSAAANAIIVSMISAIMEQRLPLLRLKTLELLMLLSDPALTTQSGSPVYLSQKQVQLATNVQARITENLSRHLTIEQLSSEFHAAPTSIKTAFRSVYGCSVYAYRKSCCLQEAQRLLRETELPIAGVAEAVGYVSASKFATAFHAEFGLTPSEYKKSVRLEQ